MSSSELSLSDIDRSHLLPDEESDAFLLSLGRLTVYWGTLDRELSALVTTLLRVTDAQAACLNTELPDVASRCRLIKSLTYAYPNVPQTWRNDVGTLCNRISNDLGQKRNRYIHDVWVEDVSAMKKIDRRAKIIKPQSFKDPTLKFNTEERLTVDDIDELAIKIIIASTAVATARFDMEALLNEGQFPESPQLEAQRIQRIDQFRLPLADGTPRPLPVSSPR